MPTKNELQRRKREFSRRDRAKRERSLKAPPTDSERELLQALYRIFAEQLIAAGNEGLASLGIEAATDAVRGLHQKGFVELVTMPDGNIGLRLRDQ